MNSPFNALTVFTKFMSSPTDALEIISKVVSSPQDVLQFIKNLMDSPENAMDIMNKFINTPAEALRMLNQILNGSNDNESIGDKTANDIDINSDYELKGTDEKFNENTITATAVTKIANLPIDGSENTLIHSMLNYPSPNDMNCGIFQTTLASPAPPTTPSSIDSGNYVTPPPSAAESLNITSPLANDPSSPSGVTTTSVNTRLMATQHDELPSTSSVCLLSPPSEDDAAAAAEFANEHFDIKTFIQNSFPENATGSYTPGDSLSSLESVLTEVIRIEFQAFNNLPPEPRVKQEQMNSMHNLQNNQNCMGRMSHYGGGNAGCIPQQQSMLCQEQQQMVCSPSTSISMSKDLNETELLKLRELKMASEALFLPVDADLSVLMSDDRIKVSFFFI